MAVLRLSGSAEPGASVNVAPGEEKSLCPGAVSDTERGRERGPEVVGKGERAPVLAKGSVQGIVCKKDQDWRGAGGLAEGLKQARGYTGWGPLGGTWALHARGGFEEGLCDGGRALVAPRVFVIYCPPPRDLNPFLLLLSCFSFPPPILFFVLIAPTVSSGRGTRGGEWRLGKGPLLSMPQGFT